MEENPKNDTSKTSLPYKKTKEISQPPVKQADLKSPKAKRQ